MMRRSLMLLCLLSCLSGTAWTQDGLDGIRERLAQPKVLRGEFTQQKHLAGFRNPLRSSGSFVLSRERGIVWETLAPFPSKTVITSDRILSRLPDGSMRVEMDGEQQPALAAVNALLFALFAGDVAALSERFETTPATSDATRWTLGLVPKPGALDRVFLRLEVQGDAFVRRVRIEERGGDVTEIAFEKLSAAATTLSDDEARQFE